MKKIIPTEEKNDQTVLYNKFRTDALSNFKGYSSQKEIFHHIDKPLLISGEHVNFSIFTHKGLNFQPIIQASEKSPVRIPPEILNIEGDFGIKHSDIGLYDEYLNFISNNFSYQGAEEIKAVITKEKTKIIIRDILLNPRSGENIKRAEIVVQDMTSAILSNKNIIYALIPIKTHDYYTYTHSVNVKILCIGFGFALGLSRNEILNLGLGALLHDIGKSFIPTEILNKQGELNNIEFKIIKKHVIEGEKILKLHKDLPKESIPAVTQHHEKLSGTGYPYGITASEINLFGKITAIADCYDALTTERPYKPAMTPFQALNMILHETGSYDHKLLRIFIQMLGKTIW